MLREKKEQLQKKNIEGASTRGVWLKQWAKPLVHWSTKPQDWLHTNSHTYMYFLVEAQKRWWRFLKGVKGGTTTVHGFLSTISWGIQRVLLLENLFWVHVVFVCQHVSTGNSTLVVYVPIRKLQYMYVCMCVFVFNCPITDRLLFLNQKRLQAAWPCTTLWWLLSSNRKVASCSQGRETLPGWAAIARSRLRECNKAYSVRCVAFEGNVC